MEKSNKYRHLFSDSEWDHFLKLGAALHDPSEKKEFFQAVIEGKQRDPSYEISGYVPKKRDLPSEVCSFVRSLKKEETPMMETPQRKELKELGELFGRLISEGRHLSDKEIA